MHKDDLNNSMNKEIFCSNFQRMQRLAALLTSALEELDDRKLLPLNASQFHPNELSPSSSLYLDGFRARYSDLQDMLGTAMFQSIARLDEDESLGQELSTRERVVLMEKRGIIDAIKWQDSREIRNSFAHDYPDQHRQKAENFNAAREYSVYLLAVVKNIEQYIQHHYGVGYCD
jgi:hypothetical protein